MSFFDLLQFCRYFAIIDKRKEGANQKKNERNLCLLFQHRFGNKVRPNKNIVNLSDRILSDTEEFDLSHGLNFCLPLSSCQQRGSSLLAEFKILYAQLVHHKSQFVEQTAALRGRLSDLAHAYCGSPIDVKGFLMSKECFQAIKSVRSNNDILITKPDKGAGFVILNKHDYVSKMDTLLYDASKFENLGLASQNDNTTKIESQILELKKKNLIPVRVYEAIQLTGSQMYVWFSQNPQKGCTSTPHLVHESLTPTSTCKWLTSLLGHVLQLFSTNCIPDTFTFVETLRNFQFPTSSPFLCSFNIASLFTNVPLQETNKICVNTFYDDDLVPPQFLRKIFIELMQTATSSVEYACTDRLMALL